jgi:subtilisin family serine protease
MTASRDTNGHGTHVAGIASGVHNVFGGVAPSANILFVKTDFSDSHIASGIRYIFRVARELNRPAVVNLSLGGHFDAHDGTDDLSALIDQESGPGRVVVCAAGNEGEDSIHATGKIKKNVTTSIRVSVPRSNIPIVLNGWYSGTDRFDISLDPPSGAGTGFRSVITTGNPSKSFNLSAGRVLVATPGPDPVNGDVHFQIEIHPPSGAALLKPGAWKLNVRGATVKNGRLDVWATDFEAGSSALFLEASTNEMKIGSPGCSRRAVTVAAFSTRTEWVDRQGDTVGVGFTKNALAPFSSPGPLRNKIKKPDVAAPGAMIVSALSADSAPDDPQFLVADTKEVVEAGTSMASPFIAGVVALLLQSDPTLTPEGVKQRLKTASRIPNKAAGAFATDWGFGLIDGNRL